MKKILVIGGTGFLGYHTIEELLEKKYSVVSISLPPIPSETLFEGKDVENILADVNTLKDEQLLKIMNEVSGVIYAIGSDERVLPNAPAFQYYYQENVLPTQRIAHLASKAGVEKFVVFGSYYSEFSERMPDLYLEDEPYAKARLLQEELAFAEGEGTMHVMSLRLPYIFGTMPGRESIWKAYVERIRGKKMVPSLPGGTAMVTAKQVAQAAVGALENGVHRKTYAISGINMKYHVFYEMIVEALGQSKFTSVPVIPLAMAIETYEDLDQEASLQGKEHGIHMVTVARIEEKDFYIDPFEAMEALGYEEDNVLKTIRETLKSCI
ncbi:NAD(P)-dependent oxidoreductase [Erysipelothrix urinaevulpis]|uniref:NAD-dependent epimerase/dehydratase family protein n=1 Tax=Erysipelothrix urinaevulpis TaxID=2683717 RepID=UPI001358D0B6|nr:NAD(P)-dependent oxidoreductase [Erysipelothrix urinaevulpis]